jgi:hypothetical protein
VRPQPPQLIIISCDPGAAARKSISSPAAAPFARKVKVLLAGCRFRASHNWARVPQTKTRAAYCELVQRCHKRRVNPLGVFPALIPVEIALLC